MCESVSGMVSLFLVLSIMEKILINKKQLLLSYVVLIFFFFFFLCRLQNKVIDLEVENGTPSPTVDPSVHVFLVGHSMGGIVGAETLLLVSTEQPIPPPSSSFSSAASSGGPDWGTTSSSQRLVEPGSFMFPHIQGLLAFDTPFLGIAPGVVSYGVEGQYKTITNTISDVAGMFGFGRGNNHNNSSNSSNMVKTTQEQAKEVISSKASITASTDAAATPSWQRWGRYAMFAGAIGAVAAGGAAAIYQQRQSVATEWNWVSSHLEFIGCLARPGELFHRLELLAKIRRERGIGCTNFYTCLGKGAQTLLDKTNPGKIPFSQKIIRSKNRTFCFLPQDVDSAATVDTGGVKPLSAEQNDGVRWTKAVNNKAGDEIKAHTTMFLPKENPGFYDLAHDACDVIVNSVDRRWYHTATTPVVEESYDERRRKQERISNNPHLDADGGFMDDVVVVD